MTNIQNPGSALDEAIGTEMEKALSTFLTNFVEGHGYHFISQSPILNRDGTPKKLLMYDKFGVAYNVDAIIANESMQPIILIESKYIRYKKHNRDKGSWICTAHPALRRRYHSIRTSIAVLAGNWSSSALTMIRSYNINVFLIPFQRICDLLAEYGIDFNWEEKDRETAVAAWQTYSTLTSEQKSAIGQGMISVITAELQTLVLRILDDTTEREIERITIELHSNLGEVKSFEFMHIETAVAFLKTTESKHLFLTTDSLSLFDPSPDIT